MDDILVALKELATVIGGIDSRLKSIEKTTQASMTPTQLLESKLGAIPGLTEETAEYLVRKLSFEPSANAQPETTPPPQPLEQPTNTPVLPVQEPTPPTPVPTPAPVPAQTKRQPLPNTDTNSNADKIPVFLR